MTFSVHQGGVGSHVKSDYDHTITRHTHPLAHIPRGRVDDLSFLDGLSPFCFLLIESYCTFYISYKILANYVDYYCILIRIV